MEEEKPLDGEETALPRMRLRLSAFWFVYMAGLGIFFPFYSLYLRRQLDLSGTQVGWVMGTIPLVGLLTQPLWGRLADRTGSRQRILVLVTVGTGLAWTALALPRGFVGALLGTGLLAVFFTAVLPMAAAVSMAGVRRQGAGGFGVVRMWGTLGFLSLVMLFPHLLEALGGGEDRLRLIFPSAAAFALLSAVIASRLPASAAMALRSMPGESRQLLRHDPVVRLLAVTFVAHACMMGPINLFPLFVAARGGDVESISQMWIFMLLLEAPLIGMSRQTLRWLTPRGLLTVGLLAEALRWLVCASSTDLEVIRWMQLLHGVGVAGVLIGAPLYVEEASPERLRSTGQALAAMAGPGAGAFLSNVGAGWLFETVGPAAPYTAAGLGTLGLGVLLYGFLPQPSRPTLGPGPGQSRGTGGTTAAGGWE